MNEVANLLEILKPTEYKIHAARWNKVSNPLDVFLSDREEWRKWTAWFNGTHDFNRPFVLSLMDYYHERDAWLFGGIYHVRNFDRRPDSRLSNSHAYDVELSDQAANLIGRLKIKLPISGVRKVRLKAENYFDKMSLIEVLRRPYSGPGFVGYDKASLTWSDLVSIVQNDRIDWKTSLVNMKGVYLITFSDGRNYVGSAYGDVGIWSRWRSYALSRHGGNKEMIKLYKETNGAFIEGAQFTLIEAWPTRTADSHILERESYWKDALKSRESGLNGN